MPTPKEQAVAYTASNGFHLDWDGSRVLIYRTGGALAGSRAKYGDALKFMMAQPPTRVAISPTGKVVNLDHESVLKLEKMVTHCVGYDYNVKDLQAKLHSRPWALMLHRETGWVMVDRGANRADIIKELRQRVMMELPPRVSRYAVTYCPY